MVNSEKLLFVEVDKAPIKIHIEGKEDKIKKLVPSLFRKLYKDSKSLFGITYHKC